MFYSAEILTKKKHGLAIIWLAATLGNRSSLKKISKRDISKVNIPKACEFISSPPEPIALRLSSNLLIGLSRVFDQQCQLCYGDVAEIWERLTKSLVEENKEKAINLGISQARFDAITLPKLDIDLEFFGTEHIIAMPKEQRKSNITRKSLIEVDDHLLPDPSGIFIKSFSSINPSNSSFDILENVENEPDIDMLNWINEIESNERLKTPDENMPIADTVKIAENFDQMTQKDNFLNQHETPAKENLRKIRPKRVKVKDFIDKKTEIRINSQPFSSESDESEVEYNKEYSERKKMNKNEMELLITILVKPHIKLFEETGLQRLLQTNIVRNLVVEPSKKGQKRKSPVENENKDMGRRKNIIKAQTGINPYSLTSTGSISGNEIPLIPQLEENIEEPEILRGDAYYSSVGGSQVMPWMFDDESALGSSVEGSTKRTSIHSLHGFSDTETTPLKDKRSFRLSRTPSMHFSEMTLHSPLEGPMNAPLLFDIPDDDQTPQKDEAILDAETVRFFGYTSNLLIKGGTKSIYFHELISPGMSGKTVAAKAFYHILALATNSFIELNQEQPYKSIYLQFR